MQKKYTSFALGEGYKKTPFWQDATVVPRGARAALGALRANSGRKDAIRGTQVELPRMDSNHDKVIQIHLLHDGCAIVATFSVFRAASLPVCPTGPSSSQPKRRVGVISNLLTLSS